MDPHKAEVRSNDVNINDDRAQRSQNIGTSIDGKVQLHTLVFCPLLDSQKLWFR